MFCGGVALPILCVGVCKPFSCWEVVRSSDNAGTVGHSLSVVERGSGPSVNKRGL